MEDVLYWNYKDGSGTKAEGEKSDVNYSRDLCWIFVLWLEKNIGQNIAEKFGLFLEENWSYWLYCNPQKIASSGIKKWIMYTNVCFSLRISSVM